MGAESGQRLAKWRKGHGISQRALGSQLGVSQGYISDIEAGRSEPSRNFLIRLQERFGLRTEHILYGDGDPLVDKDTIPSQKYGRPNLLVLKICGSKVQEVYADLGLSLASDTHFAEAVWFYNELLQRVKDPEDGDELEAIMPQIKNMLKTRVNQSNEL